MTDILLTQQAGNGIYDLFDRVLVLAEGQCIYYGPRKLARGYFEGKSGFTHLSYRCSVRILDLGFICADGANVADL